MTDDELRNLRRIVIVAAGTAYHAGVVGRYVIEEWARIPVEPDIASEWIYRNPVVSQGHARDRHLAIGRVPRHDRRDRLAREIGARTLAITNMMGSQITREVDSVLYTRCGLEIGVAASKTFTAQVALLGADRPQARAGAQDAAAQGARVHRSTGSTAAGQDRCSSSTATIRSTRSPSGSTTSRSSSTSVGTSAFRSRSRARSS